MTLQARCDLCKKVMSTDDIFELGKWVFHAECYNIVLRRLGNFMNLLLLPQDEFDEWLEDDI